MKMETEWNKGWRNRGYEVQRNEAIRGSGGASWHKHASEVMMGPNVKYCIAYWKNSVHERQSANNSLQLALISTNHLNSVSLSPT